ncbi:putative RNA-directed DNA polymerase [Helianthus debilis subsp. tardiflorus]
MTKTDVSNPSLHPAYSVNNIQSKVRTLDGTTVTYSAWIKLFKFHATAYRVLNHLDDTPPPAVTDPTYPAWKELDALVSQWIYSCVSDDYLQQILDTKASARQTWLKLEKIFLSNKRAKAAALETQFVNLTLSACSSLDDYCKQLKNLANQLADVDQQITEERLVLQLVRGLSKEFDTTASLINSQAADWDTARSMLNDEVIRQAARHQQSSTVLATTAASQSQQPADNNNQYQQPRDPNTQYTQSSNQYRGRGRGRGNQASRGRGSRGRGYRGNNSNWAFQNFMGQQYYPQWAWWNTPPCPYPTQPNWRPNTPPQPPSANYTGYPAPATYGPPAYNALCPSDLSAAINNVNLTYTDPTPHMDTGAERHVTDNQAITLLHIQESPATQERIEAFWKLDPAIRTYPPKSKDPVEVSSTSYTMSSTRKSSKLASRFSVSDLDAFAASKSIKKQLAGSPNVPDPNSMSTRGKGAKKRKAAEALEGLPLIQHQFEEYVSEIHMLLDSQAEEAEQKHLDFQKLFLAKDQKIASLENDVNLVKMELVLAHITAGQEKAEVMEGAKLSATIAMLKIKLQMAKEAEDPDFDRTAWDQEGWKKRLAELDEEEDAEEVLAIEAGGSGLKDKVEEAAAGGDAAKV